ncbi:Outer membrane transporter protein TsaT [marine metagenome]|tara:strand:- start:3474 stop:4499 length:1026 start_codon:yes stop_codon:yes gene_type:complete
MFKRLIILAVSVSALSISISATANTKILLNCFTPAKHVLCHALRDWKEQVEAITDKRVRIAIPAKSMAPPPEQMNSVRGGLVDAAIMFNGFSAKEIAGPMVAMNPFTGSDKAEANSVAVWRTYEKFFADKDEYKGVKLLGLIANPGAHFYSMTDKPIKTVVDIKERKMWALPGATAGMLKAIGSSVVSGPAVQMTEIIQRGVVDGFVGIPPESAVAFNVLPYAKSITQTPRSVFTAVFSFFISDEKWNEISDEDKKLIESVSYEVFAKRSGEIFDESNGEAAVKQAKAIQELQASDAFYTELQEIGKPFSARWIKRVGAMGVDGQAALDFYINQIDELSGE